MARTRKIEVFSAGCAICDDTIALINKIACPSCEVEILDMHKAEVASRAKQYGVHSIPAVVIDGRLADCCTGTKPDEYQLRAAGIGSPL